MAAGTTRPGYVTYDYLEEKMSAINKHIDDHDAWHLGKLEAELAAAKKVTRANLTTLLAAMATFASMYDIFRPILK